MWGPPGQGELPSYGGEAGCLSHSEPHPCDPREGTAQATSSVPLSQRGFRELPAWREQTSASQWLC